MKQKYGDKLKSAGETQLEQLARELETEEGRKRLGEEAYKEAISAEKRKSIHPKPSKD
ncbi:hypothetical protein ACJJIF_04310 [Microbulbifer sp. SSSA002]|uniref:hypothetical protein n=1 Tax=unclassified Microbulbifer TaxID=2619833 RepID=UPI00403952A1